MRVLLRIDAEPPDNGKQGGYFAVMLSRLREWHPSTLSGTSTPQPLWASRTPYKRPART